MNSFDAGLFRNDYSLEKLTRIAPRGHEFFMHVTPRFLGHYSGGYEVFSARLIKRLSKKCDLFLDVGAQYGFYSLLAVESNPNIQTISVEPVLENFEILKKNLEGNGFCSPLRRLAQAAVGRAIGEIELFKSAASDNCGVFEHPNAPSVGKFKIPITTIDKILCEDDSHSVFIKIDTEGNELDVLKGMEKTFEKYRDLSLLVEMNPKMLKLAGTNCKKVTEYLASKGFNVYGIDDKGSKYYPLEDDANLYRLQAENSFFNALCIKKEKALSVAFFSHSSILGGAERSLADLVEDLCNDSVLCSVLLPSDGPLKDFLLDRGAAVYVLPGCDCWWVDKRISFCEENQRLRLAQAMKATVRGTIPALKQLSPDVVYTQTIVAPWGALCAEILSIPHALSVCEYGELDHHFEFYFGFRKSIKALCDSSKAVFSITKSVKNEVLKGLGDEEDKVEVVYRSVRIASDVGRKIAPQNYDYKNKPEIKIVIMGTICEGKGQEDIVRAGIELMKKGLKVKIYIVGCSEPHYLEFIKNIIDASAYKDNFIIKDFADDPIACMAGMDVVVSCSRSEAAGRTLFEAILLGKPIVYCNSGGPQEIFIDGEHGLAYNCADEHNLAEKLLFVMDCPEKTYQRVKQARKYVLEKFAPENYSGKIESRLRKIKGLKIKNDRNMQELLCHDAMSTAFQRQFHPTLYYSEEGCAFDEVRRVSSVFMPVGPFSVEFELPDRGYPCLRFDPHEGRFLEVKIYDVTVETRGGAKYSVDEEKLEGNGEKVNSFTWRFDNSDPSFTIRLTEAIRKIRITGEIFFVGIERLQKGVTGLNQTVVERDGQIVNLNQVVAERDGKIVGLSQIVAERDGQIANLNQVVAERDGRIVGLNQTVAERDSQIANLNRTVADRDGQIVGLSQTVAKRDGQIASLNQTVTERDGKIVGLNQTVAERDRKIVGLNQIVAERDEQIASLIKVVAERDGKIAELKQIVAGREKQIADLNQIVIDREAQMASLNQIIVERNDQITGLTRSLAERDSELGAVRNELHGIYTSKKWKLVLRLTPFVSFLKAASRSRRFNAKWYLSHNPDVAASGMDAYEHYIQFGKSEGRRPVPESFWVRCVVEIKLWWTVFLLEKRRADGVRKVAGKAWGLFKREGWLGVWNRAVFFKSKVTKDGGAFLAFGRNDYDEWIRRYDTMTDKKRLELRALVEMMPRKPLISIVMPVYNSKPEWLIQAIESVRSQIYPRWELCIADDASTDKAIRPLLERYAKEDPRIKIVFRKQNGHISAASNSALELATGEWIALLDHDDLLAEHALFWVAEAIHRHPQSRLIYSDEDKLHESGKRFDPYFKCDWNVDLFFSHNLITHLGVYQADLLRKLGGFRLGFEGAQDYDLALRCIELIEPMHICHIPRILYHWRAHVKSTSLKSNKAKPYALPAGKKALDEYFARQGVNATAIELSDFGMYRVRYALPKVLPLVSLIILTRNKLPLLQKCVESILSKTTYPNYEILIVDNGSDEPAAIQGLKKMQSNPKIRVVRDDRPFNYSALNNAAVKLARGEVVGLLNNDLEVISSEWLSEMVSHVLRPGVGAVGAKLWYPNNRLQHGGVVIGLGGVAGHSHKHLPQINPGYFCRAILIQSFSAVTAACLVIRKSLYMKVGGLKELDFGVAFNDVDFCLRIREAGYRNIWTPYAELYHHESATRGFEDTPEKKARFAKEIQCMKQRWGDELLNDPAYSPNLTLDYEDFSLAWPPRIEPFVSSRESSSVASKTNTREKI